MTQLRNAEMVDLLRADFQARYEPNFAWKSACSLYLELPALRGFWPGSSVGTAGLLKDLSGHGHDLIRTTACSLRTDDLVPYWNYDGTAGHHSITDQAEHDITGLEAYISGVLQGLTMGCWMRFQEAVGTADFLIGKWLNAGNQRSYRVYRTAAGNVFFEVSTDGAAIVDSTAIAYTAQNTWIFVAGRFDPSTELRLWINQDTVSRVVGIPASIFNGAADFQLAAQDAAPATNYLEGDVCLSWLCAGMLEDSIINAIFQQTRAMFGV